VRGPFSTVPAESWPEAPDPDEVVDEVLEEFDAAAVSDGDAVCPSPVHELMRVARPTMAVIRAATPVRIPGSVVQKARKPPLPRPLPSLDGSVGSVTEVLLR